MITVPIWVFVFICSLAFAGTIGLLIGLILYIGYLNRKYVEKEIDRRITFIVKQQRTPNSTSTQQPRQPGSYRIPKGD